MNDRTIADIRARTSSISNDEVRKACEKITDEVLLRVRERRIGNWTFHDIANWIGRAPTDPIVQVSISRLADRQTTALLEMHFLFFDASEEYASGEPIADEYVLDAYRTGNLVHPSTGLLLRNFESVLAPYFVPALEILDQSTDKPEASEPNGSSSSNSGRS